MTIHEKFLQTIKKYSLIQENDSVLVALSAGPDSTLLLYLLKDIQVRFNLKLGAVYINHQIRKKAAKHEEIFCQKICDELGVEFHLIREDIPRLSQKLKKGLEETGRDFRYSCFQNLTKEFGYDKVALGHHADDRVETILFRIIRGTGKKGLSGIRPKRENYVRPLFDINKDEILEYLKDKKIKFCSDLSNQDNSLSRNYIRNELIPELKEKLNPSVETALLNLSETEQEEERFLESIVAQSLKQIVSESQGGKILVDVVPLKNEELWLRRRIYRSIYSRLAISARQIDKDTIDMMDDFLFSKKTAISLPGRVQMDRVGKIMVLRQTKKISFQKKLKTDKLTKIEQLQYIVSVKVKDISATKLEKKRKTFFGQFDYSKLTVPFTIRTIQVADRFSPLGLKGNKKIGDYLTDRKISPVFRDEIPVVADKKGIFWLVGFEIDNRVKIDKHTKEVLEIELTSEK